MLYPDTGHEVIDRLRAIQLVANQMPDNDMRREHVRMSAGRLPLHELFGMNFDAGSEWYVFDSLEIEEASALGIKREPIEVRGQARGLSIVYDSQQAIDTIAVRLSNLHIFLSEEAMPVAATPEGIYTVQALHLPVLAITSWAEAA